ncbi:MAG TPA: DUF1674 domain-containing protein [Steroidobacteraceae bacterium]
MLSVPDRLRLRGLLGRILADFRAPMQATTPEFPAPEAYAPPAAEAVAAPLPPAREVGGPSGPEPTRYGDWERKGRCIDF